MIYGNLSHLQMFIGINFVLSNEALELIKKSVI